MLQGGNQLVDGVCAVVEAGIQQVEQNHRGAREGGAGAIGVFVWLGWSGPQRFDIVAAKGSDVLQLAAIEYLKIFASEIGDGLAARVHGDHIQLDHRRGRRTSIVTLVVGSREGEPRRTGGDE